MSKVGSADSKNGHMKITVKKAFEWVILWYYWKKIALTLIIYFNF